MKIIYINQEGARTRKNIGSCFYNDARINGMFNGVNLFKSKENRQR